MNIRQLDKKDSAELAIFLNSLDEESLKLMNRFGRLTKESAKKIGAEQANLDPKKETGYIVEEGKKMIGYGFLRFFPEKKQKITTCSLGIVISKLQRGKGIGKALMKFMINDAKSLGMKKIWLGTYSINSIALKLYREMGFQVEGIFMSDEYFSGKPYHTVSMAKFLDGTGEKNHAERKRIIEEIESSGFLQ
jgi:RimJ/RimL family protein N-acetyltransferase